MFLTAKSERWPMLLAVVGTVVAVVFAIRLLTNDLPPKWDTEFYLDMATHGTVHIPRLAAPFA